MAGPTSLSANFYGISIPRENNLLYGKWKSLEDNAIAQRGYTRDWLASAANSSTE